MDDFTGQNPTGLASLPTMTRPCRLIIVLALSILGTSSSIFAQDAVPELQQAKAQFQKEVDFTLRPVRDRYLSRLQALKRTLATRGDVRAAVAVQDEIDLITAITNEAAIMAKFVGTWVQQGGTEARRYTIRADGRVEWLTSETGAVFRTGQLSRNGKDFLIIWEGFDHVDRITLVENGAFMESFAPKANYPNQAPLFRFSLTRSAVNR